MPSALLKRGVALAFVLAVGCSGTKDPKTLNGTALWVTVFFETQLDVRSMEFIGTNAQGNDVFMRDSRPSPPSTTALKSPQTARILLPDELDGKQIDLAVFGSDGNGEVVEYGGEATKVELGRETDVTINMKRFSSGAGGGAGGGSAGGAGGFGGFGGFGGATGGGAGGGAGGAGGGAAGGAGGAGGGIGPAQCRCDGGCCLPGTSSCAAPQVNSVPIGMGLPNFVVAGVPCGAPSGQVCLALCDPERATRCDPQGNCRCGDAPACGPGMRCGEGAPGKFGCTCDPFSQCPGCCGVLDGGVACRTGADLNYGNCGAAGRACAACSGAIGPSPTCTWGAGATPSRGACSTSLSCLGCSAKDKCCSHMSCLDITFPTCRSTDSNACVACDIFRSDTCSSAYGCGCGAGPTCFSYQSCVRATDGGLAKCQ